MSQTSNEIEIESDGVTVQELLERFGPDAIISTYIDDFGGNFARPVITTNQ